MAVIDKTLQVSGGNQVNLIYSTNTELMVLLVHLIVRNIDAPISISFYQGNERNQIDTITNTIIGDDILAEIEDCEGNSTVFNIAANGNYIVAINTFFGKWGEVRLNVLGATTGDVRIISNTIRKV